MHMQKLYAFLGDLKGSMCVQKIRVREKLIFAFLCLRFFMVRHTFCYHYQPLTRTFACQNRHQKKRMRDKTKTRVSSSGSRVCALTKKKQKAYAHAFRHRVTQYYSSYSMSTYSVPA